MIFELTHLHRNGRLGNTKMAGCTGEAAGLSDSQKVA